MGRVRVLPTDLVRQREEIKEQKKFVDLPSDFFEYKADLYRSLAMPSYVHGYSLAIEYMKSWFLSKFPKDFFKTVYINGKHVLDEWKHFNNYNIVREKPMLAIVPTVEFDYDREQIDLYMADQNIFLKRSNYQQAFLKDYRNKVFLNMQQRALRMNFTFKIRVRSRAEQLDLFNKMEIWFRIGATQQDFISVDFHVPYEIMLNIAKDLNFDIENDMIINVCDFISYLNSVSDLPFIFKMRAINQKPEFFIRMREVYTHIACKDKLQLDDGERIGKTDDNFHIEMQTVLTIPIPYFYVYFSEKPIDYKIEVKEPSAGKIGIYSINLFEIPPINELNWSRFILTSYLCEPEEKEIDLKELFNGQNNINKVIDYNKKNHISPYQFIEVKVFHSTDRAKIINCTMDYENFKLYINDHIDKEEMIDIAFYYDRQYVNDTIISIEKYNESRIKSEKG